MGFSIRYRTTRPVNDAKAAAIRQSAEEVVAGRTWLGCEPPLCFTQDDDGHLVGFSKPNFHPHPDDAASAARSGLPNGTTRDMLDVLCRLSQEHGIDWALGHDYDPAIGFIRGGECDLDVANQIEALAEVGDMLGEMGLDGNDL